jgi:hypothetical protein
MVYRIESGAAPSLEAATRVATALDRRLELELVDPRRRAARPDLAADLVHSAMGEFEARRLRRPGIQIGIDEPYQHYQFAGRADLLAWDVDRMALLHIENRTRFPDFQESAGAFNSKRAYLGGAIAERVGGSRWASETHVLAALWSAEVMRAIRRRAESFRALCPDGLDAFEGWWAGRVPAAGRTSILVVLDPMTVGRARTFVGLDAALSVRPRYHDYAAAATTLDRAA